MTYSGGPMTEAMYYVLLALLRPNHGYRLMSSIKELSKGRIEMGPGTLYGVLSRMLNDGLIETAGYEGRRKIYIITDEGKKHLEMEYKRLNALLEDGAALKESFYE